MVITPSAPPRESLEDAQRRVFDLSVALRKLEEIADTMETTKVVAAKADERRREIELKEYHVVVAGLTDSGKTTLINTVLEEEIVPTDWQPNTMGFLQIRLDPSLPNKAAVLKDNNKQVLATGREEINKQLVAVNDQLRAQQGGTTSGELPIYRLEVASWALPASQFFRIVLWDSPGPGEELTAQQVTNQVKHAYSLADVFIYVVITDNVKTTAEKTFWDCIAPDVRKQLCDRLYFAVNKIDGNQAYLKNKDTVLDRLVTTYVDMGLEITKEQLIPISALHCLNCKLYRKYQQPVREVRQAIFGMMAEDEDNVVTDRHIERMLQTWGNVDLNNAIDKVLAQDSVNFFVESKTNQTRRLLEEAECSLSTSIDAWRNSEDELRKQEAETKAALEKLKETPAFRDLRKHYCDTIKRIVEKHFKDVPNTLQQSFRSIAGAYAGPFASYAQAQNHERSVKTMLAANIRAVFQETFANIHSECTPVFRRLCDALMEVVNGLNVPGLEGKFLELSSIVVPPIYPNTQLVDSFVHDNSKTTTISLPGWKPETRMHTYTENVTKFKEVTEKGWFWDTHRNVPYQEAEERSTPYQVMVPHDTEKTETKNEFNVDEAVIVSRISGLVERDVGSTKDQFLGDCIGKIEAASADIEIKCQKTIADREAELAKIIETKQQKAADVVQQQEILKSKLNEVQTVTKELFPGTP